MVGEAGMQRAQSQEGRWGWVRVDGGVADSQTERRERIRWTVGRQSKLRDKILGLAARELESER